MVTRRRVLLGIGAMAGGVVAAGGAGVALVEFGLLPGRAQLDRRFGLCDVEIPTPKAAPGPVSTGEFRSKHMRGAIRYTVAYPPGHQVGARLPVLVLLHGAGWRQDGWFAAMRFHRHLADAVDGGARPLALAACDGGSLFWHARASGQDPQAMVMDEFLPLLAGTGLRTDRIAVLGCSMGGYGALLLAENHPDRVAAAVASSPALSVRYGGGAFDSPQDFARHDVIAGAGKLRGIRVRVDCGESEAGRRAVERLRDAMPDPSEVRFARGCHDPSFWESLAPAQLRWVAAALDER